MKEIDMYLSQILQKYFARDLRSNHLDTLKYILRQWASTCYIDILDSGSRAKGTAIHLSSDYDFLVSLTSNCNDNNGGLKGIYESLYARLKELYVNVRRQSVSVRMIVDGLEVDVTPAKKQSNYSNDHSLFLPKLDTWKKTNVQKHIFDVSSSGCVFSRKMNADSPRT